MQLSKRKQLVVVNQRKKRNRRHKGTFHLKGVDHVILRDINSSLVIPMSRVLVPKSTYVRLTWPESTLTRNNATNQSMNWSYRLNSVFDPDPSFGTGAIPGFAEYANFYARYRVHGCRIRARISALDPIPSSIIITPVQVLSTNNTISTANLLDYAENPLSLTNSISGVTGGPTNRLMEQEWSISNILGEDSWLMDPNYSAAVTANPTTNVYLQIGAYVAGVYTLGLSVNIHVDYDVEFYQRNRLFS